MSVKNDFCCWSSDQRNPSPLRISAYRCMAAVISDETQISHDALCFSLTASMSSIYCTDFLSSNYGKDLVVHIYCVWNTFKPGNFLTKRSNVNLIITILKSASLDTSMQDMLRERYDSSWNQSMECLWLLDHCDIYSTKCTVYTDVGIVLLIG